ncbi:hypothetical protein D9757_004948 [Collybiopsis confluens]|uniref:Uncharacterized protein n=1 Tax=Collybiopsis confluens TaxID=2823264 RepID=A0A8H5HTF8_9AGAR|nr:hypothetical protein D9757_004948 [Collybiopsis confluens]
MEQPPTTTSSTSDVELELVLPTPNESVEDDDAEIEELLSSFYFDNSEKRHSTSTQNTHSRHKHTSSTIEHLNPIYEEDEMLYDLYGKQEQQQQQAEQGEDQLPSSPSSGSVNSYGSDDEESSSCSPDIIALPYGSTSSVIHVHDPSRFWPVIEEDDDEGGIHTNATITFTTSRSPPQILLEEKEDEMQDEEEEEEDMEWAQRGRSRAVPARLVRWATRKSGKNADREVSSGWIRSS